MTSTKAQRGEVHNNNQSSRVQKVEAHNYNQQVQEELQKMKHTTITSNFGRSKRWGAQQQPTTSRAQTMRCTITTNDFKS